MNLTKLITALASLGLASAWQVNFSDSTDCSGDQVVYTGEGNDGSKDCMIIGETYEDEGVNCLLCDGQVDWSAVSIWYPTGTNCCFGTDAGFCANNVYHDEAETCTNWSDLQYNKREESVEGKYSVERGTPQLFFRCWDH